MAGAGLRCVAGHLETGAYFDPLVSKRMCSKSSVKLRTFLSRSCPTLP